tara:strand:- start:12602 stop:13063 length:462 start_codon:yes stop_codon:yes gene_type:complete
MAIGGNMKRKQLIPEEVIALDKELLNESAIKKEQISVEEFVKNEEVIFIVEPSRRKAVKKAKVYLGGKLNLNNSTYIYSRFKYLLTIYNILDFKFKDVEELDISSIQIFYFFKTIFSTEGKEVNFQVDGLPLEIKTQLTKLKYNKILLKKPFK